MTTAVHLAALLAIAGAAVFVRYRYAPRRDLDTARNDRDRHLRLAEDLVRHLAEANTRLERATEIADERRAEANELRVELERRPHADLEGEHVVVITKDQQSIDGDVARVYADGGLRIDHARYLSGRGQEVGGTVTIAGENISWVQQPDTPAAAAE